MDELSFDIKNSLDFYNKLLEDYEDFLNNKTSSRIAINCAMTSWHLADWIYNEFNEVLRDDFEKLKDFQNYIKQQCVSLQVMHDITNGSKHYLLIRHNPTIKETNLHRGSFDSSFDRSFNISTLDVELKNGEKKYFEDEIKYVINFWKEYLNSLFKIF